MNSGDFFPPEHYPIVGSWLFIYRHQALLLFRRICQSPRREAVVLPSNHIGGNTEAETDNDIDGPNGPFDICFAMHLFHLFCFPLSIASKQPPSRPHESAE